MVGLRAATHATPSQNAAPAQGPPQPALESGGWGRGGSPEALLRQLLILILRNRTAQVIPCHAQDQVVPASLPPGPPHHRQHLSQLWNHLHWPSLGSLIWLVLESNVRAIAFGLIQENYLFGFVGEFLVHFQPRGLPPSPSPPAPGLPRTSGVLLLPYTKLS